jgi:fatty acid amide hydrolase
MSRDPQAGHFTALYNLLGWPSGVVATSLVDAKGFDAPRGRRASRTAAGGDRRLPVGVQVAARPWREDLVLNIMDRVVTVLRSDPGYPYEPPL